MKHYIGTKKLQAIPMTLGEYNEKRGWIIPENEDPSKEGYFVQYSDDYCSWSPKEVFEESYVLERINASVRLFEAPHQQRVVDETRELADKTAKLKFFIEETTLFRTLTKDEQMRMKLQLTTMECYYSILVERIDNF